MALRVWLPLNKDIQILPVLSTSMAKESGISITEENGWFKIADASHTSSRWGAYMDFEVEPGLTYILSCDLKAGTRSAKVGFDSFAGSRSWPTDRITSSSTTGERKSYTLVTARGKYARVYFNLAPTALGDYAYFKNPTLTKITNLGISNINITEVSTSAINENTGKIGKCLTDNGTAYWAISPITLGSNCSICCWTKTSINGKMSWVLESNANATLNLYESTYYALNIGDGNSNLFKDNNGNSITCLHDGKWHHFVVTFDGTSALLYIDGEYRGKAITFRNPTTTNGRIKLGGGYNNSHSYDWNGDLNDFRIYDHCLSPLEVKEISQGLILHYKLDGFSGGAGENILPNTTSEIRTYEYPSSSFADRFAVITTKIPEAEKYTLSFYAKSTVAGDKIRAHYYSPNTTTTCVSSQGVSRTASDGNMDFTLSTDWQLYWVTYTQTSTTAVKRVILPRMGAVGNTNGVVSGTGIVSIKCVKMEEGERVTSWSPAPEDLGIDTTKIIDSSGYGNDGILTGTLETSADTSRYQLSSFFNGNDTAIQIPYNATIWQDNFTMNLWFKKDELGSKNYETLIGGPPGFEMDTRVNNATTLSLYMASTRGGNVYSPFNFGEWYMITLVNDGTNELYYVNGSLVKTIEKKSMPTGNYFIGAWQTNIKQNYKGNISDVRIYATALSAEDIATLYHTPAQIDNLSGIHGFEFEEAGEKDSIYKNGIVSTGQTKNYLVNNFAETNTLTDWTFTSPTINNGIVTTTGTAPLITSKTFTVNPDDIIVIKFTLSMPTPSTSTSWQGLYLGTLGSANTNRYLYNFNTHTWGLAQSNASSSWNTYFLNGYNSTDTVTIKSYILGNNVNIADVPDAYCSLSRITSTNAIQLTSGTTTNIRAGYNSGNTTMVIQLSNFEIYNLKENGIIQEENNAKTGLGYIKYSNIIEK